MQAIETKFIGATNHKPSRIRAVSGNGHHRLMVSYDYELSQEGNHEAAALALATKLDWLRDRKHAMGSTREGYVLVFIPR